MTSRVTISFSRIFLFAIASRPALRSTQPPIQWVPRRGSLPGSKAARPWSWPLTSI